jgi:hypothetical protein
MSFDLFFCRQDGTVPSILELTEYFLSVPRFQVNDLEAGGVEFRYQNDETGVYCGFSYLPPDGEELEGCVASGLAFNLAFNRPSFFAYETMPLVEDFCKHFQLQVVDTMQDESVQLPNAEGLIASWRRNNTWAISAMKNLPTEDSVELHYLPETSATRWWQYMRVRQALEDTITEDTFVPSPFILMTPAEALFTMLLWPKGISQFFPRSDYVYLQRDRKWLFRTKEEAGLVSYDSVIEKTGHLLEDYDFGGLQIKYLRPEKASQALALMQSLPWSSLT